VEDEDLGEVCNRAQHDCGPTGLDRFGHTPTPSSLLDNTNESAPERPTGEVKSLNRLLDGGENLLADTGEIQFRRLDRPDPNSPRRKGNRDEVMKTRRVC
jgi:hypothetical protein